MEELGCTKINEDMLHMWFNKMKSLDITSLDYKRMFFDAFVNSVYVMDNGIEIALNYKEGTKIITFEEMKNFIMKVRIYLHPLDHSKAFMYQRKFRFYIRAVFVDDKK